VRGKGREREARGWVGREGWTGEGGGAERGGGREGRGGWEGQGRGRGDPLDKMVNVGRSVIVTRRLATANCNYLHIVVKGRHCM